jgi:hypothetical protein
MDRKYLDRNRGMQHDIFSEALKRAAEAKAQENESEKPLSDEKVDDSEQ